MNERMKQLAYDAGIRFSTTGTIIAGDSAAIRRLVELIVLDLSETVLEVVPEPDAFRLLDKVLDKLGVEV
jgi:hypothetical protein